MSQHISINEPTNQSVTAPEFVRNILASCDGVAFDVDSTVITEEGIDVLADSLGLGAAVSQLTTAAMSGSMLFEDALKMRLDLLKPSKQSIEQCLITHPLQFTPGFIELIQCLREHGKRVYLITGGFRQMLGQLMKNLSIDPSDVFANELLFDDAGSYIGFDRAQPTSKSGGKAHAIRTIKQRDSLTQIVMIGDGVTDLETMLPTAVNADVHSSPAASAFIGYGGVTVRERVKRDANWFVHDWKQIIEVFDNIKTNK